MHQLRFIFIFLLMSAAGSPIAQSSLLPDYSISNMPLPSEMNNQVCISGMKYMDHSLFLASERCPVIFEIDPESGRLIKKISIQVPQEFEMEGMSSYKGKLYSVSENIAAVYEVDLQTGTLTALTTSIALPAKTKNGDGMEGIATNEAQQKFYLLRERNEERTATEIYSFTVQQVIDNEPPSLVFESKISIPLENHQWRYSDICFDPVHRKLLCLKSYSKGKLRQQFLESIDVDHTGALIKSSRVNIPVTNFSEISNEYKEQDYSMNLEGLTMDEAGNLYIVSDNTSGKAKCDRPAKEKTILLKLKKK